MTFILTYFNQLHLENIMVLVFSKLVSIILLLIFFVIFKKLRHPYLKRQSPSHFLIQGRLRQGKKPYLSSFTTP